MKLVLVLLSVRAATGRTNMLILMPILRRWTVSGLMKRFVEEKRWSATVYTHAGSCSAQHLLKLVY